MYVYGACLLLKIVCFSLGVLKYVVCLCKGCDGCFLYCNALSCRLLLLFAF